MLRVRLVARSAVASLVLTGAAAAAQLDVPVPPHSNTDLRCRIPSQSMLGGRAVALRSGPGYRKVGELRPGDVVFYDVTCPGKRWCPALAVRRDGRWTGPRGWLYLHHCRPIER